jgi:DNA topoisomerase-1
MPKILVIIESPTKKATIAKYLSSDYQIEASFGHIRDLPEKNIGVDIATGFTPTYEVMESKKKRVAELRKYAKNADQIILATDPDKE